MSIYNLGTSKHVFADWDLIEPGSGLAHHDPNTREDSPPLPGIRATRDMPFGVTISAHRPRVDKESLLQPDTFAEGAFICYVSIFEDDGLYRMYTMNWGDVRRGWDNPYEYMLTYAESTDGKNWTKPSIGTVNCNGSTDNNLVYGGHAAPAFKDPSAPPSERYKLVGMGKKNGRPHLFGAVSEDGRHFRTLEKPLLDNYASDTHTVVRFDPTKGKYVGYFRGKNHGRRALRTIAYAETDRFDTWPVPEVIVTPDLNDEPDTDIYTNSYTPWPGADAHLMFPAFYQRRLDDTEIHMMTSRDGLRWERPMRQPIIDTESSGLVGSVYAGCELLSFVPGEWALPISPRPTSHNAYQFPDGYPDKTDHGYVCLASWRQDGFTSLEAETEGFCSTIPFTFAGGRLEVNAWTRFGGGMRFELADASVETKFEVAPAIPGHTFEDSDPVSGDHLNHVASWQGDSDISAWSGRPVRLRFRMRRARLHGFQFV